MSDKKIDRQLIDKVLEISAQRVNHSLQTFENNGLDAANHVRTLEKIGAYQDGLNQEFPKFLEYLIPEAQQALEAERNEYLRLQKKFENQGR